MRVHISHASAFHFEPPATGIIKTLHLTPRNHDGQDVIDWRIELSENCRLDRREDAFGNIVHTFSAEGPLTTLTVIAEGDVDTSDTAGIVRHSIERFPPHLFLRETPLTAANAEMTDLVTAVRAYEETEDPLSLLHGINRRIHETVKIVDDPSNAGGATAAAILETKAGVYQDVPHLFIAMGRVLGIPCRYVSGYYGQMAAPPETGSSEAVPSEAGVKKPVADSTDKPSSPHSPHSAHAWAEAHVPDLGWVTFDPVHADAEDDFHIRIATGLDYLGVAPVRGASFGEGVESLTVAVKIGQALQQARQAAWQTQN